MKNSSKQSVKMDMLHGSLFDKMLMFAMPLAPVVSYSSFLIRSVLPLSDGLRAARL